jgi:hypothetical protein
MKNKINWLAGNVARVLSICLILIGLPAQMLENYQHGNTDGFSTILLVFMTLVYGLWATYAWTKDPPDRIIGIPQTVGFFASLVMWVQWFYYNWQWIYGVIAIAIAFFILM